MTVIFPNALNPTANSRMSEMFLACWMSLELTVRLFHSSSAAFLPATAESLLPQLWLLWLRGTQCEMVAVNANHRCLFTSHVPWDRSVFLKPVHTYPLKRTNCTV